MALGNRLLVVVDAEVKGAIREIDRLGNSAEKNLGSGASSKVTAFGGSFKNLAVGVTAAGAAFAAGSAVVSDLVGTYTDYASKVREVQRVSGATAEESSGLTYAFEKVGIGATKGAAAVFQLEKRIGTGQLKLADYGTQVKRTADGGVDLVGTLGNIADAYKAQTDPARRAALVMAAFGRQGKDLIPILASGRDRIKELFDEAGRTNHILDQGDLDRAKEFTLAVKELNATFEGLKIKAGNALTPVITDLTEMASSTIQIADSAGAFDLWGRALQNMLSPLTVAVQGMRELSDAVGLTSHETNLGADVQKAYSQALSRYTDLVNQGKKGTKEYAEAKRELNTATRAQTILQNQYLDATGQTQAMQERLAATSDTYKASIEGVSSAQDAAKAGDLNAVDAAKQLAEAYDKVTAAKEREASAISNSIGSLLATEDAQRRLNEDLLKSADAYTLTKDAAALADAKTAEYANTVQATTGHVLTAQEKLVAQRQALVDLAAQNPQTAASVQPLISKLDDLIARSNINLNVHADGSQAKAELDTIVARANALAGKAFKFTVEAFGVFGGGRAAGGPVNRNVPYLVGEKGPEIFVPNGSGRILNARDSAAKLTAVGSSGGGNTYQITVSTPAVTADTGRVLVEHIRAYERNSGSRWRQN